MADEDILESTGSDSETNSMVGSYGQPVDLKTSYIPNENDEQPTKDENVEDDQTFSVDAYVNRFLLQDYIKLKTVEEKKVFSQKFKPLELLAAIQNVSKEVGHQNLESYYLNDFLEKNDPKMLIGLKMRIEKIELQRRLTTTSSVSDIARSTVLSKHRGTSIKSMDSDHVAYSMSVSSMKGPFQREEYDLNEHAKTEMIETTIMDVSHRFNELEMKGMNEIKSIRAQIEEITLQRMDTEEVFKNFQIHFLRDASDLEFLEIASERQIERKFRKFMTHWVKNARALLGTLRLRINAAQDMIIQQRTNLVIKSDLSIITPADFELLVIKRNSLKVALKEKNNHLNGIKSVSGRATISMSQTKQLLDSIEEESRLMQIRINDLLEVIKKLENEIEISKNENIVDKQKLDNLRKTLEKFEAPSIFDYIERKNEFQYFEKEEKILQRKIYLMQMKLKNVINKVNKLKKRKSNT